MKAKVITYLKVEVWSIISQVYQKIGRPIDDISTLINSLDDRVWQLIADGITTTINQCDSDYDKQILKKYKPQDLSEMAAYVAAIRPGFASLLQNFIERKPYTTDVDELDELLKDSYHYMLYQESIMTYLIWLGIPESKTYDIIKKISKKKFTQEEQDLLKATLLTNWKEKLHTEEGFNDTWKVVEDAAHYSFNASHALSVAIDALYGAYLKTNYPLEYYSVVFDSYSKDKVRTRNLTNELAYFGIKLHPIKFGKSRGGCGIDKENNAIYKGVGSVKDCNITIAEELYQLSQTKQYDNFLTLLCDIKKETSVNSKKLTILIKLNYFSDFGNNQYLLDVVKIFNKIATKKQFKKAELEELGLSEYLLKKYSNKETAKLFKEVDTIGLVNELIKSIPKKELSVQEQIKADMEYLEYTDYRNPKIDKTYYIVLDLIISKDPRKPRMILKNLNTGKEVYTRIKRGNHFINDPFKRYSILKINKLDKENKVRPNEEGKWVKIDEYEDILNEFEVIKL